MIPEPGKIAHKIRAGLAPCSLASWPTPVDAAPGLAARAGVQELWLKREDRAGGSKVRALEFLLTNAAPDTVFVTIGGTGSTHCLATATHATRLGARAVLAQFAQPHSETAAAIAAACRTRAAVIVESARLLSFPLAVWRAWGIAGRMGRRRWIAGGGAVPLGVVGHFLAGLELGTQMSEPPDALLVPLGSSGTVAGLLLAMSALAWSTTVVGVRVASRVVANRARVRWLAAGASRVVAPFVALPGAGSPLLLDGVGAGYGHATVAGETARRSSGEHGLALDTTYGAKTFAVLPELARRGFRRVVFWHTFAAPPVVEMA